MKAQHFTVLLIEDNHDVAKMIGLFLADFQDGAIKVEMADRLSTGLKRLTQDDIDGVFLDLGLPDSQGLGTFRKVQAHAPHVPIIVLSGTDNPELAHTAVREGAQDYLIKGEFASKDLQRSFRYAVTRKSEREALRQSEQRYKQLLEAVTDYVFSVRVDQGRAVETVHGEGCTAVTGYTPQDFARDPFLWYRMIHDEDRRAVMDQTAHALAGADTLVLEHRIHPKSGSVRWIRNTIVVRRDSDGKVISYEGLISNVTERKRVEEALRTSEQRYRWLFERNQAGILVSTLEGEILDCNESFAQMLGYASPAEIRRLPARELYCQIETRSTMLADLYQQHTLINREMCLKRKDGQTVWILATVSLLLEGDRRPILHGTIIDITERKHNLEALRNSEALYHSLVQSIPLSMFRKDLEGRFTFANQRLCQTLGKSLEDIVGKTDRDFYPQALAEKYQRDDAHVIATGEIFEDTESHQKPNGEVSYVAVVKTPVYDAQQRIIGTQGMFWDVTASKWAEEQKAQLRIARAIQQKLLPPKPPQIAGFDFGGASYPAEACSGDYFDYIEMERTVDIVLGDVSGHGFGPALLAAVTHACLRTLALSGTHVPIEVVLSTANRLLLADTDSEHFVTLIFARLDLRARTLSYSNAGHPTGYVLNAAGEVKSRLAHTGPLLGVFPEADFPMADPVTLTEGDLVLFLSDGVLDAAPVRGERFGVDRTLELVRRHQHQRAQDIVHTLCQAALACYDKMPQRDDVTAVAIKVGPG